MWDRKMVKAYAKRELKNSYWLSFAVCLVAGILSGGGGVGSFNFSGFGSGGNSNSSSVDFIPSFDGGFDSIVATTLLAIIAGAMIVAFFIGIAITVFWSNPIEVGKFSFFVRAPYGDRRFTNLFSSLKGGRYMSVVKTMFFTKLYITLWSLLFIIPGIVKSYQYRMVPYIIGEDPSLSPDQAMDLSRRMTDGEKWAMFVLDLSFIGWYLLGALAFGIGVLFVTPYAEATWAQLYFILKGRVTGPNVYGPYPDGNPYGPYPQDPYNQVPPGM